MNFFLIYPMNLMATSARDGFSENIVKWFCVFLFHSLYTSLLCVNKMLNSCPIFSNFLVFLLQYGYSPTIKQQCRLEKQRMSTNKVIYCKFVTVQISTLRTYKCNVSNDVWEFQKLLMTAIYEYTNEEKLYYYKNDNKY